jgi:hypothetical protein
MVVLDIEAVETHYRFYTSKYESQVYGGVAEDSPSSSFVPQYESLSVSLNACMNAANDAGSRCFG